MSDRILAMRWGLVSVCLLAALGYAAERPVEFNRDVRPILSDKCFVCHGPDAKSKNIPFRLDSEAAAKAELPGGRYAIVEGDAETSAVFQRITHENKALRMPPAYTGTTLSEAEIETLRRWISSGAKWEKHWSFIPPRNPGLPAQKNGAWVQNPIDAFILERLEREGLQPSPEAPKERLLRRVSLDLTGLPPTPQQLDAFLADHSPAAYEAAVDRLLASPAYAERMAYRWLDYARYSDTNGYQFDGERSMWRWRDWVIEAFNRNMPYDQFALEQIAGDMLPNATLNQKIATGFNRNHRGNSEFGIIADEYAVEYVVDRIETTSAVFLGLTFGCARCHNHKYDPLTQKEFYQVYAYFNNVPEQGRAMKYGNSPPVVPAPTKQQQAEHVALNQRVDAVRDWLRDEDANLRAAQASWERTLSAVAPLHWAPESGREADPANILYDIEDRFTVSVRVQAAMVPNGAIWSRMQNRKQGKGFGMYAREGKLHVHFTTEFDDDAIRLNSGPVLSAGRTHHVLMTYSGSRMPDGIHVYVDGKEVEMDVELDTLYRPLGNAGRPFKEPFRLGEGGGPENNFNGTVDEALVYSRALNANEVAALAVEKPLHEVAAKPEKARGAGEQFLLRAYFLENAAPAKARERWLQLQQFEREREALERSFPTVMVMAERAERRPTHLLLRGQYDKPGELVEPGIPAQLHPLPEGVPNNRLGFARWMVTPENPLTARVAVNRFWQMIFGTGLVKTVEDFGLQGEWPSHPELLDWLATDFVDSGWDIKALMKTIVTSATYRQDSVVTPELLQRDPENRLLARGSRVRLPAEAIRDQALFVAGLLNPDVGGPSVKPYQPDGLWKELSMQDMDFVQSTGDDLYRRSLYTFWKRTVAPPMLANFDAANRETCVVRESRTNTPLQALNLMNDVQFVEAARFLGQRMLLEGGTDAAGRLRFGFRLATGRYPRDAELAVLQDNLRYHFDYFADGARAKAYIAQGEGKPDRSLAARELAAYGAVGSLLLNLDETVTKE